MGCLRLWIMEPLIEACLAWLGGLSGVSYLGFVRNAETAGYKLDRALPLPGKSHNKNMSFKSSEEILAQIST